MFKITDQCVNCGACEPDCPVEAISENNGARVIDQEKCISCGSCVASCPAEAIAEEQEFMTFLGILFLIAVCIAATVVFVFPLWKFATAAPVVYTAVVLILCAVFIVYSIVRKIISRKHKIK